MLDYYNCHKLIIELRKNSLIECKRSGVRVIDWEFDYKGTPMLLPDYAEAVALDEDVQKELLAKYEQGMGKPYEEENYMKVEKECFVNDETEIRVYIPLRQYKCKQIMAQRHKNEMLIEQ